MESGSGNSRTDISIDRGIVYLSALTAAESDPRENAWDEETVSYRTIVLKFMHAEMIL